MNFNLWLVLSTAVFYGLATGVYEYVLPQFWFAHGMSYREMGIIFAVAGMAMVLVRIYLGGLSDLWGRKPLFGLALAVCGLSTAALPMLAGIPAQFGLKIIRDTASLTRETIFPIVLYEEQRGAFLNFISKFRGVEFLVQAGGTLLAGFIIAGLGAASGMGFTVALYVAGGGLLFASFCWSLLFREHRRASAPQVITLRELLNFDLHRNLLVILVAGIIFNFGVSLSHSFFLPLFFGSRFPLYAGWNPLLMTLHRVTIALPLLLVGNLRIRNLRAWYCWGFIIEGVTMAACALIPRFWASAGIFLLHDLIGAGIWSPIQATMIQRFSRDATRGIEVGKVLAWTSIGSIIGPIVAGFLANKDLTYPFFFSGLFMMVAAIPLLWLRPNAPEPVAGKILVEA